MKMIIEKRLRFAVRVIFGIAALLWALFAFLIQWKAGEQWTHLVLLIAMIILLADYFYTNKKL